MKPVNYQYPPGVMSDLRLDNIPTEGGLLGCGLLQSPVDTPWGEYQFAHSTLPISFFGRVRGNIKITAARFRVTAIGAGSFLGAQLAFLTGPNPTPDTFNLTVRNVIPISNVFLTTGNKVLTMDQDFYEGTNLYVGLWVHFETTQPKFFPLGRDYGVGMVRSATTATDDPFSVGASINGTTPAVDGDQTGVDFILSYSNI